MRRSKESQKAHLLNELSASHNSKKVIATRGSRALSGDYKKTENKNSYAPILYFSGVWIVLSVFLWFMFFVSIISLVAVCAIGLIFIAILKKFFIKEENYQLIKAVEEKKDLSQRIEEFNHLFGDSIKESLDEITQNISYLEKFSEKNLLNLEQEHYIQSCKNKHLIDLFNILNQSHKEHLCTNQENVLEQLKGMNDKLKRMILEIQKDIEVKIKVKSVFNKDRLQ